MSFQTGVFQVENEFQDMFLLNSNWGKIICQIDVVVESDNYF